MDKDIERRLKERYEKSSSHGFEKFIEQNPDLRQALVELVNDVPWFENIRNAFVAIGHDIFDVVKCIYCGQPLKVENAICGKHHYCSKKCADLDPEKVKKQKHTCLDKYGTTTPLLNDECKKKTVETCRKKFGNDMFAGSDEYKKRVHSAFGRKEVQEKSRQTLVSRYGEDYGKVLFEKRKDDVIKRNMDKYGVPYVLMDPEKQKQSHDTMEEKYGARYFWQSDENNKLKYSRMYDRILTWSDYVIPLFTREDYGGFNGDYRWRCVKCGNEFIQRIYITGLGHDRCVPRCPHCFPLASASIAEIEVADFVKEVYGGEVKQHVQTLLDERYELDIVIPDKRIAIEYDGCYWHNDEHHGSDYHLMKTEKCIKAGYHLIHVFEHEWNSRKDIVKDRIKSVLGIYDRRIYARKCNVMEIDSKTANEFLDANHLQGGDHSSVRLGLFHENELVAVMTFGRPRFNEHYDWELIRFASLLGTQVAGGAGKMLSFFRNGHAGSIISYADRRYSNGELYSAIGFRLDHVTDPSYCYVGGNRVYSRYQCQRRNLPNRLGDRFDENLTEEENMEFNGFAKLYDCGNYVFVMEKSSE